MPTNQLAKSFAKFGIDPVGARAALRDFAEAAIAAGDSYTCGVHDFGVFFVRTQAQRWISYDDDVWKVDEHTVLKLRPPPASTTKLTESDHVEFRIEQTYASTDSYEIKSTSRAANFAIVTPTARAGESWKLWRHKWQGQNTLILARSTYSDAVLKAMDAPLFNVTTGDFEGIRLGPQLNPVNGSDSSGQSVGNPRIFAEVDAGGLKESVDATFGKEVVAWFRQRAYDFA